MGTINIVGAGVGTALSQVLLCDDIEPGSEPSYQLSKLIYTYHPLGKRLADTPVSLAQSQPREISIPTAPDRAREAFEDEWERLRIDSHILNVGGLSRVYGIAAIAILVKGLRPDEPLDFTKLAEAEITFNVFDPLNMAGSLVLDLNPNSFDFLKPTGIRVNGERYAPGRFVVKINEKPIYLDYSNAAFGFSGRSVYQRGLYALKSFIRTMITDEMVARKAGLLVAKMVPPGSIVDGLMTAMFGVKRQMLKEGETDNVLGITPDESIETLNMQNVNTAMEVSRRNIINNIAAAADMPAIIINSETYVAGFGEGTEDAKNVARYVEGIRAELADIYTWFDKIVMYRAWSPAFYKTIQATNEDFANMPYNEAFQMWSNSFRAIWPSLIEEPDSEKVKVADTKLKAIIALIEVLLPACDPDNKAKLISWAADNFNTIVELFQSPLELDYETLAAYEPPVAEQPKEPGEPKPFSAQDSVGLGDELANKLGVQRFRELARKAMEAA